MIMNRHALAKDKVEKLKLGYSTFAESKEVATLIEQEINALQLNVYIHKTSVGYWFIPRKCPPIQT